MLIDLVYLNLFKMILLLWQWICAGSLGGLTLQVRCHLPILFKLPTFWAIPVVFLSFSDHGINKSFHLQIAVSVLFSLFI